MFTPTFGVRSIGSSENVIVCCSNVITEPVCGASSTSNKMLSPASVDELSVPLRTR